jgi:hypothetical protein
MKISGLLGRTITAVATSECGNIHKLFLNNEAKPAIIINGATIFTGEGVPFEAETPVFLPGEIEGINAAAARQQIADDKPKRRKRA